MFPVLTHPQYLWGVVELPHSPPMVAQVNRMPWPLIALLIAAAGCGGGTDGTPAAPPTAPAPTPTPTPPPEPPSVRAVAWVASVPSDRGYFTGESIEVYLEFEQVIGVEGSPRLAIEIGEHVRLGDFSPFVEDDWPPERPSLLQRFRYQVGPDDTDPDGISIAADALDFTEGAFMNQAGVEIEVEIYAVSAERSSPNPAAPGENLTAHRVIGPPTPRVCTNEPELAENFSPWVRGWDGTPFRVDVIRNFPDIVTEADLVRLLQPIALLDEKIERQLGYRIVEAGDVIPVPQGAPPGWDEDEQEYRRTCPVKANRDQILVFYMDDTNHASPESEGQGNPTCGSFCFLQPMTTPWPCLECPEVPRTVNGHYVDAVTVHEIFHILGFVHFNDYDFLARREGVPMSRALTWVERPDAEAALWADIDLLRCIFPQGG